MKRIYIVYTVSLVAGLLLIGLAVYDYMYVVNQEHKGPYIFVGKIQAQRAMGFRYFVPAFLLLLIAVTAMITGLARYRGSRTGLKIALLLIATAPMIQMAYSSVKLYPDYMKYVKLKKGDGTTGNHKRNWPEAGPVLAPKKKTDNNR